jgi:hypothetical protein
MRVCVDISRGGRHKLSWGRGLIWLFLILLPAVVMGAEPRSGSFEFDPNFSYAAYLGTGVYTTASGDNLGVLNIPIAFPLLGEGNRGWGLDFNIPIALGFVNYDFEKDLPSGALPEGFDAVTVLPGLEFHLPLTDSWSLHPFVDLGLARNLTSGTTNGIYGGGVISYYGFNLGRFPFLLGNRLFRAGYRNLDIEASGAFSALETGLYVPVIATGKVFDRQTDFSLYYENYIYSENLLFSNTKGQFDSYHIQNEIGFTWGASLPSRSNLYQQPRIGLGVRLDGDTRIYRLVFGMPFF